MFQSCNIMLEAENKLAKVKIASWQIKYVCNMYKVTYYVMYKYVLNLVGANFYCGLSEKKPKKFEIYIDIVHVVASMSQIVKTRAQCW